MRADENERSFRLFGPDETASNRLQDVYEVTDKVWQAEIRDVDEHLARSGHVMEILSEHTCKGWLEGSLLTGRHGLFPCSEASTHLAHCVFNLPQDWMQATSPPAWGRTSR